LVAAVTVALAGLGGASVNAATPGWTMDVVAAPASVAVDSDAGFIVTISNPGPSNINQVILKDKSASSLNATYVGKTQGTCSAVGAPLDCSLGTIRANQSATVTVAYVVPAGTTVSFDRLFEATTTGIADDAHENSHGDILDKVGSAAIDGGSDFAGRFITNKLLTVGDTGIGASNNQSTTVTAPEGAIGVSVKDGPTVTTLLCAGCWSETSEIHVNGGALYTGGFKVEVGIYKDLSQTVHGVFHQFDAGHVPASETITTKCSKSSPPSEVPCFSVSKLSGGSISVTVWLKQNGSIRFN
jgi:hypothetical protein